MGRPRQLPDAERAAVKCRLGELLARRDEIRFACLHGSFIELHGFRDVDLAVWVDPARVARERALDYALELAGWLEAELPLPMDVKVLNDAPLSFQYAVTAGQPVFVRDPEEWFTFRERTWQDYLDFAPLARATLLDLLTST